MILYGASGHAKVIIDTLELTNKRIDYIVDDNNAISDLLGYEVKRDSGTYDCAIISIGNSRIRKEKVETLKVNNWETAIHPSAIISRHAEIGEGTVVMANAVINSCANVGKHCIVNTSASLDHDVKVGNYVHIAPHAVVSGGVTIGEGSWIGVGACVKQGVKIGKWCMIGAGSVVVKDIPDGVVAYGNPCRVIKENPERVLKYKKGDIVRNIATGHLYRVECPTEIHLIVDNVAVLSGHHFNCTPLDPNEQGINADNTFSFNELALELVQ